uniref:Uncharacterized protein n=1 Tax=Arundo donax TaxID=35708 RepID=A0A0A9SML6_ARUDO
MEKRREKTQGKKECNISFDQSCR